MNKYNWTDNDINILREKYANESLDVLEKLLDKPYEVFRKYANKLGLKRNKSSKEHILKTNIILNKCNEYNYTFINYIDNKYKNAFSPFTIICENNHTFETNYNKFINIGTKCFYCANQYNKTNEYLEKIINKANKLNYKILSTTDKITKNSKFMFMCDRGHVIETIYSYFIVKDNNCNKCRELTKDKAISRIKDVCKLKKYLFKGFSNGFIGNKSSLDIKCNKDHEWNVIYSNFVSSLGRGCPYCNASKGELQIQTYLENLNIEYIKEKTFENCRVKNKLRFDFYIKDYNMCIEYDGAHHFIPIKHFGGSNNLKQVKKHDEIKTRYCKDNNIRLLRISYLDDIHIKLNTYFNES